MQEALSDLENVIQDAGDTLGERPASMAAACGHLSSLEEAFNYEMRYVHGPDWELKPGRLITRKGTWLKKTTRFSWDIPHEDKLYVPEGVGVPILQIGRVTDPVELRLHEWSEQHLRVWVKPAIITKLEARRNVWYVYWPHWKDSLQGDGISIAAAADTWMKRTTGMSGEMQPFELIYVPKGMVVQLTREPEVVDEEWEVNRHGHVNQHRRVTLSAHPTCLRRDKFDIFGGQPGV
jgi:hypothetical protein